MSWGKDPSKWGTPVTIRFRPAELQRLDDARRQADLWGRQSRSEFIREAALGSADKVLLARRVTPEAAARPTPSEVEAEASVVRADPPRPARTSPAALPDASPRAGGDAQRELFPSARRKRWVRRKKASPKRRRGARR